MQPTFLSQLFDGPTFTGGLIIVGKTVAVYIFLVCGLRLMGKRELGQMSIYDFVLIVVLGNAVQNAMMNSDNTLGGGIIAAITLLVSNWAFNNFMRRSKKLEHLMVGGPTILLSEGKPHEAAMRREGVTMEQLEAALREHGLVNFKEVHLAILEIDGTISIVPAGSGFFRTRRHYRAMRLP